MKKIVLLIVWFICIPAVTFAANGQPFQELQNEIDALNAKISAIQINTVIYGMVTDGCNILIGSGFTCTHPSTGEYLIKFNKNLTGSPVCVAQVGASIALLSCVAVSLADYSGITVYCTSAQTQSIGPASGIYADQTLQALLASGNNPWFYYMADTDVPSGAEFMFICVQ